MIFLFPRWDMLVPWRVPTFSWVFMVNVSTSSRYIDPRGSGILFPFGNPAWRKRIKFAHLRTVDLWYLVTPNGSFVTEPYHWMALIKVKDLYIYISLFIYTQIIYVWLLQPHFGYKGLIPVSSSLGCFLSFTIRAQNQHPNWKILEGEQVVSGGPCATWPPKMWVMFVCVCVSTSGNKQISSKRDNTWPFTRKKNN